MKIARLGAASAGAGVAVLCAAGPAFATGTPAPPSSGGARTKTTPSPTPTASGPTGVPSGAPQTGDGTSAGRGDAGLVAGGAAVVLAGLAGGTVLYIRRRSSAGT